MKNIVRTLVVATVVVIVVPTLGLAEQWPSLESYVDQCVLIVKCKTEIKDNKRVKFRVLEAWKGKFNPDLFFNNPPAYEKPPEGYFFADKAHGNDNPVDGREVIFFFTKHNQPSFAKGKLVNHSTCFNVNDGKLVYASTDNPGGYRKEYTVDAFKKAIASVIEIQEKKQKAASEKK